ncbi:MAG: hypothetical protein JW891_01680 [Candidatus Lokiarchaeota archaeon]|nr:hypothetical protein [Candidatus Lokiarchaeota archaeon]
MDELFYEFKEIKQSTEISNAKEVEIILHFLSKVEEFLVLFETKIKISQSRESTTEEKVISELQKIFQTQGINLVKGKIREIFLSYSS